MPEFTFPGPPPKEALDYLRAKGVKASFDYRDVWAAEHAADFTVAKAMQLDVLQAIREDADNALAEGLTFRQYAKGLKPRLMQLGWWGKQEMTDPYTKEPRLVQLGSTRRLRTIYRTNMRTARAAGQWERIQRTKKTHPYLLYELGPSENHRPEHVSWAGILLPADDPFWLTHFTPNGWGCKCRVRQVSKREYERLNATGRYITSAPRIERREWVNKRTGEVLQVPSGIDPGWDYNPGAVSRQAKSLEQLGDKLGAANPAIGAGAVRNLVKSPGFTAWFSNPDGAFPVGMLAKADAERIGATTAEVRFSRETLEKQKRHHPELQPVAYVYIQDTIEHGQVVQDGEKSLIYLLEEPGYVTVVKATKSGKGVWLQSFRRLSGDQAKKDAEVRRLLKKGN